MCKHIRHLKRLFQLAVYRRQIEENPFKLLKQPRCAKPKIRILSHEECSRLLTAACQMYEAQSESDGVNAMNWYLLILAALCTGMRRGELLNLTWKDIDFEKKMVEVQPKADTAYTWLWHIKDSDNRTLPFTGELIQLLAEHQVKQPEKYPYVFIQPRRYDYIQELRKQGRWTVTKGSSPLNNFERDFKLLLKAAKIVGVTFHDLRRTCLSGWFANGLREFDVTSMAGHASFETTRRFYLAIQDDLIAKTRDASSKNLASISGTHLARTPSKKEDR